jgi:hypothetical protein
MGQYRAGYDMLNIALTVAFDDLFDFGRHAKKQTEPLTTEPVTEPTSTTTTTEPT